MTPDQNRTQPNILLIMTDQQRWDSLSCYGCKAIETPNLDRLAGEGMRFDRCYCSNPICTPSRASLMTGQPVPVHTVERLYDVLPPQTPLFPVYLREQGYQTALFGKLHVSAIRHELENRKPNDGFDVYEWCPEPSLLLDHPEQAYGRWLEREHPAFYRELLANGRQVQDVPRECHMTHWAAGRTIDYLRNRDKERPFFCKMSVFDPHNPYRDYPGEFREKVDAEKIPPAITDKVEISALPEAVRREHEHGYMLAGTTKGPAWGGKKGTTEPPERAPVESFYTDEAIRRDRVDYLASIALLDAEVGRVLDALDDEGLKENTLVVFCSDHGDMLGDHSLLAKGAYFYDPSVRVPLILRWPQRIRPETVSVAPVQLHDLTATLLHAAGVDPQWLRGNMPDSFDLLGAPGDPVREACICVYHGTGICDTGSYFDPPIYGAMIFDGRYKLNLYFPEGKPEQGFDGQLFDLYNDPGECDNLWGESAHESKREALRLRLLAWYREHPACAVAH
ncbi:sulfatase-like hydrolase/transferase [Ruficoccus amylovorans]|uniref:Sulfatase-like hydrolase/transferase n=1 Tax=Ruficoccus amylovorans TaxID=1804625 RepID=A0A842HG23_9BACT|nr:sulfatase-like hydrolase/transferase [Ruficoccus amylovorans]MBC2595219.1 sulfatase-like hydrolase/transferase [Ruficoccus amylovorans]